MIKLKEQYTLTVNGKTIDVTREELKQLYKDLYDLFEKVSVVPDSIFTKPNPYPIYGPLNRVICDGEAPVFGK